VKDDKSSTPAAVEFLLFFAVMWYFTHPGLEERIGLYAHACLATVREWAGLWKTTAEIRSLPEIQVDA
jgi:hypothetical protein